MLTGVAAFAHCELCPGFEDRLRGQASRTGFEDTGGTERLFPGRCWRERSAPYGESQESGAARHRMTERRVGKEAWGKTRGDSEAQSRVDCLRMMSRPAMPNPARM